MSQKISIFLSCYFIPFTFAIIFFFVGFSSAEQNSSVDITRSKIKEIEKHLLEQQGELRSVDIKEKSILGEIERLEMEVAKNREVLRALSSQIDNIEGSIKDGQARIQELNKSLRAAEEYFQIRLVAFYKFGRPGYLTLLMSSDTLQEFEKTIRYMKSIMDQDREVMDRVEAHRSQVEHEVGRLARNKASLAELRRAKDERMALLEKHIEGKVLLLVKAHREKQFYEKAVQELQQAAQALNQTMTQLEVEQRQRSLPKGLAQMKGKLPLPLTGKIIKDLARSRSNPLMHKKGIYIASSPGEEVRSVFPGRVDYSGWFKGYGQLVIINHGAHYFTVFAHLEKRMKEKDEMVSGGEPVGITGDPGWFLGPGVYFEIRKGKEHLDPEKWLKLQ